MATKAVRDAYNKKKRVRKPPVVKYVTVDLQMRHSFNGKFYGPGSVRLTTNKANLFLNTEHEAAQKEASLQQQRAYVIQTRGGVPVKRQVPWTQFDQVLANSGGC